MIIPRYWSLARETMRWTETFGAPRRRQLTVSRWGWSSVSQEDADKNAQERLKNLVDKGVPEYRNRKEPKVPYNGAEGVPIREEIVEELPLCTVTRNSYGARVLNTPSVLIVDVDKDTMYWPDKPWFYVAVVLSLLSLLAFSSFVPLQWGFVSMICVLGTVFFIREMSWHISVMLKGGLEKMLVDRAKLLPLSFRIYVTPNGFRLIEQSKTFDPSSQEVQKIFEHLWADPLYVKMSQRQKCFRARLTGKPWRMDKVLKTSLSRMPKGVWPVSGEKLAHRVSWVSNYEKEVPLVSACRFLTCTKEGCPSLATEEVIKYHDKETGAFNTRELA